MHSFTCIFSSGYPMSVAINQQIEMVLQLILHRSMDVGDGVGKLF